MEAAKVAFRDEMLELGHDERVKNLYQVRDKLSARATFFVPNGPQARFLRDRSGSDLILKVRQVGFTTLSCVRALDYVLWQSNTMTGIMAHKQNLVLTIFTDIVKYSYDQFVKTWGHLYNPTKKQDSSTSLSFKDDGIDRELNSAIRVMFDFRGKTPQYLHVSEAHFIEDERLLGSLNGVPETGQIILETTPNGMGGEFYRLWELFKKKPKQSPYKGFFVPWFEYYPELPERYDDEWPEDMTAHEEYLRETLPDTITPQHIWWRRVTIDKKCQGDLAKFEHEYPSNDEDCFLTNEANVFGGKLIKEQRRSIREPSWTGFLISNNKKKIERVDDEKMGTIEIWDSPNPSHSYVIGADPAGGLGKDKSAAYVKDQVTKKIVARIWADLQPVDFSKELFKLGTYYNKAWICVESNNHGIVVIQELKNMQYGNLYKRRVIDEMTNKPSSKVGFLTTNDSKLRITEQLKGAMKEGEFITQDQGLIVEMSSFMQFMSKNGRTFRREAAPGAHDDLVMAAAFTQEMDAARPNQDSTVNLRSNPYYDENKYDPETGFLIA